MSFPNLRPSILAIDTETYDPNLKTHGPGWATGDGHLLGFSVATHGMPPVYVALKHMNGNKDPDRARIWLQGLIDGAEQIVFHNALYDIGWLENWGIRVSHKPHIHDTMLMAPLLDEHKRSYSLDSLGEEYLGETKDYAALNQAAQLFAIPEKQLMKRLGDLPAEAVAPYAEQDALLTLHLFKEFKRRLEEEDCTGIYDLERRLIPMLYKMRKQGVRVDVNKAEIVRGELLQREMKLQDEIGPYNIHAAASLKELFDKNGVAYPYTKLGKPSFTKAFLASCPHPIAAQILELRKINKVRSTFIEGHILGHSHNGRIHCQLNQLRSDEYGTVSGRFSSSNPNLQQIPARDPVMGPLVRGLFLPEEGCKWYSLDYSQQEPRLMVHYAELLKLPGAKKAGDQYRQNPDTDYHTMVAQMIWPYYNNLPKEERKHRRFQAKTTNLGLGYGMGKRKLAESLGLDEDTAEEFFESFHNGVPYVRELARRTSNRAADRGWIRTIAGRRCRFNLWEPARNFGPDRVAALSQAEALERYEGKTLTRAKTHVALNRLIQGSAADQTKMAMVEANRCGFLPHFQVHDELVVSLEEDRQAEHLKEIMEHAIELRVPTSVEWGSGANWGDAK